MSYVCRLSVNFYLKCSSVILPVTRILMKLGTNDIRGREATQLQSGFCKSA